MAGFAGRKALAIAILLAVAALASGYAVGYWVGYGEGYSAGKPSPIRMGYLHADIHHIGFFLSYHEGYFRDELSPVEVEKYEYPYGMPEMMDYMAGKLDAGYVGCVPALIAKSKGADIVIVASANLEGSAVVAREGINSLSDLDGKVVGHPGVGSIQYCMIRTVESEYGISYAELKEYSVSDLPLALEKGEIDAYIAWEPFCSEAVVKGFGHIIATSHDIMPNHQCCVVYVSKELYEQKPWLVKRILRAHIKAMKVANENPDEAIEVFCSATGKDEAVVRECWNRMVWDYHVNKESLRVFVKHLMSQGLIDASAVPDVDAFVNELVDPNNLLASIEGELS